jgi:hypothetical protein
MSQNTKIIDYLSRNGEITQRDALWLGIYRLASRINELRKAGMDITTEMREVTNADGTTSRIAVYRWVA